jgi:tRNA G10  N-methylase Trm11
MKLPFYIILGRTVELSYAELEAVAGQTGTSRLAKHVAQVELDSQAQAEALFAKLGGSIKLLQPEGKFTELSEEELLKYAVAYFAQTPKLDFSVAEYGRDNLPALELAAIKKALREQGVSSRFIEGSREGLSASVLLHHKVTELNIIQVENQTYFAKTLAVQDIDDWTRRDRGKPYADRKKGLLPPKVARMMVNLALGQRSGESTSHTPHATPFLYDPFCGSGTVLFEGLLLGCEVTGSDLDAKSVMGTETNLKWYQNAYNTTVKTRIFQADATTVKPQQLAHKVDLIVTEPFLGKPTPRPDELPNVFKGLEKLYYGTFRNWVHLLSEKAKIVIVMPYAELGRTTFSLEKIIDKIAALGYTPLLKPIVYHRPQAVIHRQIWTLEFHQPVAQTKTNN